MLPPRSERLVRQRRRYAEERIAARVAELGFATVGTYLEDWLIGREWLLVDVAAELGADRRTIRRTQAEAVLEAVIRKIGWSTGSGSVRKTPATVGMLP